MYFNT